jgi:hypothetical protein
VIYSYHPDDPADEHSLMYHGGERRGTKSVSLLNSNKAPASVNYEETKVYDFTAGNVRNLILIAIQKYSKLMFTGVPC